MFSRRFSHGVLVEVSTLMHRTFFRLAKQGKLSPAAAARIPLSTACTAIGSIPGLMPPPKGSALPPRNFVCVVAAPCPDDRQEVDPSRGLVATNRLIADVCAHLCIPCVPTAAHYVDELRNIEVPCGENFTRRLHQRDVLALCYNHMARFCDNIHVITGELSTQLWMLQRRLLPAAAPSATNVLDQIDAQGTIVEITQGRIAQFAVPDPLLAAQDFEAMSFNTKHRELVAANNLKLQGGLGMASAKNVLLKYGSFDAALEAMEKGAIDDSEPLKAVVGKVAQNRALLQSIKKYLQPHPELLCDALFGSDDAAQVYFQRAADQPPCLTPAVLAEAARAHRVDLATVTDACKFSQQVIEAEEKSKG